MPLSISPSISFVPTQKPEAARAFYEQTLGLSFESDDHFAMVFRLGPPPGVILRLVRMPEFTPAPYTILGWEVTDIAATVNTLAQAGVSFLRYGFLVQDEQGIWHAPDGASVAWFQDPDGNTLSISQHPA